jgi:hypothetical protein
MMTPGCIEACWTTVKCQHCSNDLPPRGRSVPPEVGIPGCCDEARMDPSINPRHLWRKDEDL